MGKVAKFIGKELREMVFPGLFFLIVFNLILVTKVLLQESYEMKPSGFATASMFALLGAKAVLIGEAISLTNVFNHRVLLFSVAWKTIIYWFIFMVLRCVEELIHLHKMAGSFSGALASFQNEVSWPLFWAIQIWLFVSILLFTSITEMERFLGEGTIKRAFFGDQTKRHPSDLPPVAGDSLSEVSAPEAGDRASFPDE